MAPVYFTVFVLSALGSLSFYILLSGVALQDDLLLALRFAGNDAIKGPREGAVGLAAEGHVGRTGLYTQYGWGETWASARVRRAERRD